MIALMSGFIGFCWGTALAYYCGQQGKAIDRWAMNELALALLEAHQKIESMERQRVERNDWVSSYQEN